MLKNIFNKVDNKETLSFRDLCYLLALEDKDELEQLFKKAGEIKKSHTGNNVFIRGLIEQNNICERDCFYCGIRKSNKNFNRYYLTKNEVLESVQYAHENNYSSIVIQSGERNDSNFVNLISEILSETKKISNGKMRVTLSLGEQSEETFKKWYQLGADRYLLRIETTNPNLYTQIHPDNYSLESRKDNLRTLKKVGYQLGTGVLIGFPGQTIEDLANDLIFYKDIDVDMIGMGPYIPHKDTPMGKNLSPYFDRKKKDDALLMGLKMIAAARIYLRDINIASTTALESLSSSGLEQGLLAGANVFMINITKDKNKKYYSLYDNKPTHNLDMSEFEEKLNQRINNIGEKIAYGIPGDSVHYRQKSKYNPDTTNL